MFSIWSPYILDFHRSLGGGFWNYRVTTVVHGGTLYTCTRLQHSAAKFAPLLFVSHISHEYNLASLPV